jgi:hypothetical protein
MMNRRRETTCRGLALALAILMVMGAGCSRKFSSSLLPSEKREARSPWASFDEAKSAYDEIIPYKTTIENLRELKFDPYTTPNIEMLTYLEIIEQFMPNTNIRQEDLDVGIQDCLSSKENCRAYDIKQRKISQERYGNVFLDVLNFRRRTKRTGWEFHAIIVLKDDLVVYKLWNGTPNVDETIDEKRPLGPLQDMGTWHRILLP